MKILEFEYKHEEVVKNLNKEEKYELVPGYAKAGDKPVYYQLRRGGYHEDFTPEEIEKSYQLVPNNKKDEEENSFIKELLSGRTLSYMEFQHILYGANLTEFRKKIYNNNCKRNYDRVGFIFNLQDRWFEIKYLRPKQNLYIFLSNEYDTQPKEISKEELE